MHHPADEAVREPVAMQMPVAESTPGAHCWFDQRADPAGVILTQSLPFVEPPFVVTCGAFERAAYTG